MLNVRYVYLCVFIVNCFYVLAFLNGAFKLTLSVLSATDFVIDIFYMYIHVYVARHEHYCIYDIRLYK